MPDPANSITRTKGGFDTAALLQSIYTPKVAYSSWGARSRHGAELDTQRIEDAIRWAECGVMWPVGDMIRETLALNPAASSFLGRAFIPISMADFDVTAAEGEGLNEADAKRIATDVRAMLKGIRGFKQSLLDLAWGFSDGRAALEKTMVRTVSPSSSGGVNARTTVTGLNWIEPQRLSFDASRRLIIIDRFGSYGMFQQTGPALDDCPGKFLQLKPRIFADLQEREGLAIRFLYWLLFDRLQWRHRLEVMQKMGGPIGVVKQDFDKTVSGMKLPRVNGGEGGTPGDDGASLDNTLEAARTAMDRFGLFIGRPGEDLHFEWPPPEAHQLFTDGSDQILRHLEMLALHAAMSSASTEQTRSGLVVLRTDQEILLDFRGAFIAEAIQRDLIEPHVELNYGPDALVYTPTFNLRTTPIRDRGAEVDRILKVAAAVPVGVGVLYEAAGVRAPNPGETLVTPPSPAGPFGGGGGGAPPGAGAPAIGRDEGSSGDAIGALRELAEAADADDQAEAADEEASMAREFESEAARVFGEGIRPHARAGLAAARESQLRAWFAADRKVQPASANGSPELLVERGVREGARITSSWADVLLDSADGADAAQIYRRLQRAGESLDLEPFARGFERRQVHSLMLGTLDADFEMTNEEVIAPVAFALPPSSGVADFVTMPFGEAIKSFLGRKVLTRRAFDRLLGAAKKRAFTVAGLARRDMLTTAHDELSKAIAAGDDLRSFSKALSARFDAAGWTKLNPSHVETVFRNGVMTSYSDGRKAQMTQPAVLAARPYWQIRGVEDARTRPTHKAAIGKVLAASDPFWQRCSTPFGHNCRCRVISRSAKDLSRLGLTPTIGAQLRGLPDEGWDSAGSLL